MKPPRVRVGLVGCGNAGRRIHMRLLREHSDLYEVCCCTDALPESAQRLAQDFGLRALDTVDELVAQEDLELVVVVTKPPVTHRDLALQALAAGRHVVVEKPMATDEAECTEMIAAARAAGRLLCVHHNRRWDLDFLAARAALTSGGLGQVRFIRNEYTTGFTGSPYDWGIHLVDQTMALSLGEKFVELTAAFARPHAHDPLESEGFFTCRLRTESGVLHDLSMLPPTDGNAYLPPRLPLRFLLVGTEGVFYQDWCQQPADAFVKAGSATTVRPDLNLRDTGYVHAALALPDFYQALFAALREDGPPPVPGEEGRRAVRAWELLCRSAVEGRTLQVDL